MNISVFLFVYVLQVLKALFHANFHKLAWKFEYSGLFRATLYMSLNNSLSKKFIESRFVVIMWVHWSGKMYISTGMCKESSSQPTWQPFS